MKFSGTIICIWFLQTQSLLSWVKVLCVTHHLTLTSALPVESFHSLYYVRQCSCSERLKAWYILYRH